jgi:hypothetical protein
MPANVALGGSGADADHEHLRSSRVSGVADQALTAVAGCTMRRAFGCAGAGALDRLAKPRAAATAVKERLAGMVVSIGTPP